MFLYLKQTIKFERIIYVLKLPFSISAIKKNANTLFIIKDNQKDVTRMCYLCVYNNQYIKMPLYKIKLLNLV